MIVVRCSKEWKATSLGQFCLTDSFVLISGTIPVFRERSDFPGCLKNT